MGEQSASRSVRVFFRVEGVGGIVRLVHGQLFAYGRVVCPAGMRPEGRCIRHAGARLGGVGLDWIRLDGGLGERG